MLSLNTKAPAFRLPDQKEQFHQLKEEKGKWVVLYFYPKDDTPGCTKEACAIAEVYDEFEKLGVTVFGVSKDSPASHRKFAEKYNLPFTLLADPSAEVIQKYGAWQEKSMYGKKYLGTARITYIIDPRGYVAKAYPKVSPADHALLILADLRSLLST